MGKRELNFERFDRITAVADATLVAGDKVAVYDVSAGNVLTATITQIAQVIEAISVSDAAYSVLTWNGDTDTAASKNALSDILETKASVAIVSASLAEINAGTAIIAAITGKQIVVLNISLIADGAFGTGTSIEIEDASATINVLSYAQAQLTDAAVLAPASTGVTLGAGFGTALTVSEALHISATGTFDTATGATLAITYIMV